MTAATGFPANLADNKSFSFIT